MKITITFVLIILYIAWQSNQVEVQSGPSFLTQMKGVNKKIKQNIDLQFKSEFMGDNNKEKKQKKAEKKKPEDALVKSLPGLDQDALSRSFGSAKGKKSLAMTPNINIDPLLPAYKFYIEQQTMNELVGKVDFKKLEIKSFELNYQNERLFMPYDQRYKIGDGFNIELGQSQSSPFYLPAILQAPPQSIEGQDGKISSMVAISQEDLAEKLAVQAEMWGSGWGCDVKASFSYSSDYKMSKNEVILIASHKIDLGKAFIDPSNFMLTQEAQMLLATNYEEFVTAYGTHFLAGITTECEMNALFRQTTTDETKKLEMAASLEVEYKSMNFEGGAKVDTQYSKDEHEFHKNTNIEVRYAGANDDAFVTGLKVKDLQKAILDFPTHCTGNIAKYILWPYESSQSYINVKTTIDLLLIEQKKEQKLKELKNWKNQVGSTKAEIEEKEKEKQEDYKKYVDKLENEEKTKMETIEKKVKEAQEYKKTMTLLDDVFIAAILKNRIMRVGLQEETTSSAAAQQLQSDDIFVLKSNEIIINDQYKQYIKKLNKLIEDNASVVEQLKLVKEARSYLQGEFKSQQSNSNTGGGQGQSGQGQSGQGQSGQGQSGQGQSGPAINTLSSTKCEDEHCVNCNRYATAECKLCTDGYALTNEKKCANVCPIGSYQGKIGGITRCIKCNPICKQCSSSETTCTSCNSGSYLQNSNCVKTCDNGYYISGKQCLKCSGSKNCETYLKNKCQCLSCPASWALQNGACKSSCSDGTFFEKSSSRCQKCHSYCSVCFGNSQQQCSKCASRYALQGTTCQSSCSNGYNNKGGICQQCRQISFCETYNNNCGCQKCQQGRFLQSSKCIEKCSWTYYGNQNSRTCQKCGKNCGQCSSPSACSKCLDGYRLTGKGCVKPKTECPSGKYLNDGNCASCNYGWKRCDGCIQVFDDENFNTKKRTAMFCTDNYKSSQGWSDLRNIKWGDKINGIKVGKGTKVEVFTQPRYGGKSLRVTSSISDLKSTAIGRNEILSFKITVEEPQKKKKCGSKKYLQGNTCKSCGSGWSQCAGCIKVYDDYKFKGKSKTICTKNGKYDYIFDLDTDTDWDNDIDSIKVGKGTKVILYKDAGLKGKKVTLTRDQSNLDRTAVKSNKASSLEIFVL